MYNLVCMKIRVCTYTSIVQGCSTGSGNKKVLSVFQYGNMKISSLSVLENLKQD